MLFSGKLQAIMVAISLFSVGFINEGCAQMCVPEFPDFSGPMKHSPMLQRQLVIPHFSFRCNTTITQWEAKLHWHGHFQQISRVDFQIWRLDRYQQKYHLVGNNSFSRDQNYNRQGVERREDRIVMDIVDSRYLIPIAAGDIVGFFIQGQGIEVEYKSSKKVQTYVAHLSGPLLDRFDASLESDRMFQRPFKGIPLIRALSNDNILNFDTPSQPSGTVAVASTSSLNNASPSISSSIVINKVISTTRSWKNSDPVQQKHLVGGIIGLLTGGIFVFISGCALFVLIRKRKHRDNVTGHSNRTPLGLMVSAGSETTLMSHLKLDTRRRISLSAFKRQKTAPKDEPTVQKEKSDATSPESCKENSAEIAMPNCIKMNENLCYSALTSCTESELSETSGDHEYDVPMSEITLQPCEYEMPIEVSVKLENEYDTIPDPDLDKIYEEIIT